MAYDQKTLEKMDKAFKTLFVVAFILQIVVAIVVTNDATTTPLTGSQVASVGIITVFLLVVAGVIYSQFPESILGKPKEKSKEKEKEAQK